MNKIVQKTEENYFGFTSPGTPKKNDLVEQGFYTLYFCVSVMMTYMGLHEKIKTGLWPKFATNITKL